MLPNFFVIGAQKSGTTSLHHYLGLHPEIHVSAIKEPAYFCREEDGPWRVGRVATLVEYEALFDSQAPMRGDCTPAYSQHPRRLGVPERIQELVPHARFIYLVRDPVQRILSQVQHHQVVAFEPSKPLRTTLGNIDDPLRNHYLISSLYATQLEQYRAVFPPERMLVVDSADLRSNRESSLRRIFRFLGVDEEAPITDSSDELNRTVERRVPSPAHAWLHDSPLGAIWRRLPERARVPVRQRAMRAVSTPPQVPTLDDDLRLALEAVLRPEVERLRELTGLTFPTWSI